MKKITKVVVLPDIHAPKCHYPSLKVVLEFIKDYKPNMLIQLGDLCDFDSLSKYETLKEKDLTSLNHEVESANEVLDSIEKVLPWNCEKVLLEGNHDRRPETYRLNRWDAQAKRLFGMAQLPDFHVLYNLKKRGWSWVEENKLFDVGRASFVHGFFTNQYHAAKTVRRWFKTIIYGHLHQYQVHTISGMDQLPVSAMCIGTLSRFDLSYLRGIPPDWCHMFMYMEFFGDGFFTPHPVPIINGKFCLERVYGG